MLSSFHLLSFSYPPFSPVSLSYLCRLHRHHHHFPWQCWLLAMQHLKTVLVFLYISQLSGKVGNITLLCFKLLLTFIDKVPVGGKKWEENPRHWGLQQGNSLFKSTDAELKLYLFSLVLHDFLCGFCTLFKISHLYCATSSVISRPYYVT